MLELPWGSNANRHLVNTSMRVKGPFGLARHNWQGLDLDRGCSVIDSRHGREACRAAAGSFSSAAKAELTYTRIKLPCRMIDPGRTQNRQLCLRFSKLEHWHASERARSHELAPGSACNAVTRRGGRSMATDLPAG